MPNWRVMMVWPDGVTVKDLETPDDLKRYLDEELCLRHGCPMPFSVVVENLTAIQQAMVDKHLEVGLKKSDTTPCADCPSVALCLLDGCAHDKQRKALFAEDKEKPPDPKAGGC